MINARLWMGLLLLLCSSIVTGQTVTTQVDTTICFGENYFGYTHSGGYRDTFSIPTGDSIRILTLVVLEQKIGSLYKLICYGDSYDGYSTNGVYTDTLVSSSGCDSIRTVHIIVRPAPSGIQYDTVAICSSDSVLLGGVYRHTPGTYLDSTYIPYSATSCGIDTSACTGSSVYVDVGTENNSNSFTSPPFIYGDWYKSGKCQMLFTSDELQALGYTAGKITSLAWEVDTIHPSASTQYCDFTVMIGCTNITSLDSMANGLVQVYTSAYDTVHLGWNEVTLDAPYQWDGISNLIVQVCFNNIHCQTSYTYNTPTKYSNTAFNSYVYSRSDIIDQCSATSFGGALAKRPNTRFGICSPSGGMPPISSCENYRYVTLELTQYVQVNASVSLCPGDSVFIGGNYVSAAGTYLDTINSITGCDSIVTVTVVNPPSSAAQSTIDTTIRCYQNYQGYTNTGIYVDTFTNSYGCDSVRTLNLVVGPDTISGVIYVNGLPAQDAIVYLIIGHSSLWGYNIYQNAVTYTNQQGIYSFPITPATSYHWYSIKAALLPSAASYADYLPTYLGDTLLWADADHFSTSVLPCLIHQDIHLIPGVNPGGPGFVGGSIFQGANKMAPGDPIDSAQIMLLNLDNSPLQYTYSNAQGAFSFNNVAYGTYKVYAEVLGLPTDPAVVTLSASEDQVTGISLFVNTDSVTHGVGTGIAVPDLSDHIAIYPNPVTEQLTVVANGIDRAELMIYNSLGQLVYQGDVTQQQPSLLDVSQWAEGIYHVKLVNGKQVYTTKITRIR